MFQNHMKSKAFTVAILAVAALGTGGCDSGGGTGGTGTNPVISGLQGPTFSVVNGVLTVSATLDNVTSSAGITLPIPKMGNSYIEIGPSVTSPGATLFQIGVSLTDIASIDFNTLPPTELPGGRPLPGITGGAMPAVAVEVPSLDNSVVYFSTQVVGIFIPANLGLQGYEATFDFYGSNGSNVGTISVIGEDTTGKNSGVLLLLNLASVEPAPAPSPSVTP